MNNNEKYELNETDAKTLEMSDKVNMQEVGVLVPTNQNVMMVVGLTQNENNGDLQISLNLNPDVERLMEEKHSGLIQSVFLQIMKEVTEKAIAEQQKANKPLLILPNS
jgi:hypothetical protein